jgi:hypothetical protein
LAIPAQPELVRGFDGANNKRVRDLWTQVLIIFEEIGDPRSEEVRSWLAELDR